MSDRSSNPCSPRRAESPEPSPCHSDALTFNDYWRGTFGTRWDRVVDRRAVKMWTYQREISFISCLGSYQLEVYGKFSLYFREIIDLDWVQSSKERAVLTYILCQYIIIKQDVLMIIRY